MFKKFNIITEDGGVYQNVAVLSSKGFARDTRDVYIAMKYEKGITLISKKHMNVFVSSKVFYEVELSK